MKNELLVKFIDYIYIRVLMVNIGNFARTMKRTSERGWGGRPWTSRFRKNRDEASQGHPLDPLNYNSERQLIFSKKRSE